MRRIHSDDEELNPYIMEDEFHYLIYTNLRKPRENFFSYSHPSTHLDYASLLGIVHHHIVVVCHVHHVLECNVQPSLIVQTFGATGWCLNSIWYQSA
jgi:hypothetical protein